MNLNEAVENVERKLIKMAVDKYGSGKKAAEFLGVNQSTISRKMSQYGITAKKD
jgi:TyrR family helix-turn-helix protein